MAENDPIPPQRKIDTILSSPAFKSLNHEQRKILKRELSTTTISASISAQYSGPLPPPELLDRFNQVIPNGAERIMVMVEEQNRHRMTIETTVVKNQQWQSTLGQYFALAVTIFGLSISAVAIAYGHDGSGGTIGVATVGSVAVAFITGRKKQQADLKAKAEAE
jgi:uncharacterized membrane protein